MDMEYYKQYEPIFGSWRITRLIGEGSFGKVFEMEREDFGVTYKMALKTLTVPESPGLVRGNCCWKGGKPEAGRKSGIGMGAGT